MSLAIAGWNYELVVPLALAVVAFSVYARRATSVTPPSVQLKRSLAFWAVGLFLAFVTWLLLTQAHSSRAAEPAAGAQFTWTLPSIHKAVGLSLGGLAASYLPFAVVAVLSHGKRWRSGVLYSVVLAALLLPLLAATPLLVGAGAIVTCVLLQVPQCL